MTEKPTYEELEKRIQELEQAESEHKRTEEALAEKSMCLDNILRSDTGQAIVTTDLDFRITYYNPLAEQFFGYTAKEVIGKTVIEMHTKEEVAPEQFERAIEIVRREGQYCYSLTQETEEGLRHLYSRVAGIFDPDGALVGFTLFSRDVTRRKRAEAALMESEEKYRGLFDESIATVYLFDEKKNFLDSNQAGLDLMGYSREELLSMSIPDVDADPIFVLPAHEQLLSGDRIINYEHKLKRKDGKVITVLNNSRPLTNNDEQVVGMQSTLIDITELKQAEEALRESEERYRQIFNIAPAGIYEVDFRTGKIVEVNDAIYEYSGYTKDELLSINAIDLLTEESKKRFLNRISKMESGASVSDTVDYEIIRKDGSVIWASLNNRYIYEDDNIVGSTIVAIDITERKLAEEALRKSEAQLTESNQLLAGVLEHTHMMAVFLDPRFNFIWVNRAYADTCRHEPSFFQGKNHFYLYPHQENQAIFQRVVDTGDPHFVAAKPFEFPDQPERGVTYWDWSLIPVKDGTGTVTGLVFTLAEVTERKRAEEEREKLQEQLLQSRKMEAIGSLAGGTAHEFNNILGIIIGNTALAINDLPESNPARECLEEVQTASLRAKDVVRQLLGFARKSVFQLLSVQISSIIRETLKLIRASTPTTIEIRQNLSCKSDTVMADSTQISQVLMNLCTNAKNAMQEEGGVLEVNLENTSLDEKSATRYEDLSPGNYVKLTVKDNGHGIDPKNIDRIFDPYFTTTSLAEGTGMGLAVVHGIVKHHSGAISVESEPGKGTVFEVLFPLTEAEVAQEAGEPEALPTGAERILFIDDEESLVKLGRKMLNQLGYSVETKRNPIEALELVRSEPDRFDLIITDMTMPQMTGDKLAKEILSIRPDMPIILCTGFSEKIDDKTAQALGIRKYIEKPFVPSDLAIAIRKVLE